MTRARSTSRARRCSAGCPAATEGNDVQTAYELTVAQGRRHGGVGQRQGRVLGPVLRALRRPGARANGEAYRWSGEDLGLRRRRRRRRRARPSRPASTDTGLVGRELDPPRRRPATTPPTTGRSRASSSRRSELEPGHPRTGLRVGDGPVRHPRQRQGRSAAATTSTIRPRRSTTPSTPPTRCRPGQPLALGALYHYWTCTCQGRANGPVANTTLSAAQAVDATNLKVASGQRLRRRRPDHGRHRHGRRGRDRHRRSAPRAPPARASPSRPALTQRARDRPGRLDHAGPTGLIVKAVVDHADGTRETFVTDGTWKISKADAVHDHARSRRRNGDSGDNAERYDARGEIAGWDTVGFDDTRLAAGVRDRPAPAPGEPAARDASATSIPAISHLDYETIKPEVADHDARRRQRSSPTSARSSPPSRRSRSRTASPAARSSCRRAIRLNNTTLSAATAAGDDERSRSRASPTSSSATRSRSTRPPTASARAIPRRARSPRSARPARPARASRSTRRSSRAHANARYVEGSRAGTSTHDTQGSDAAAGGTPRRTARRPRSRCSYWGWRYLQILPPGAGETLTADDITAVVQYQSRAGRPPRDVRLRQRDAQRGLRPHAALGDRHLARRRSWTRRRARRASSPATRVDISYASMIAVGDRNATKRAIREIVDSRDALVEGDVERLLPDRAVLVPEHRHARPRERRLPERRQHARHPGLHASSCPSWVWRYYEQSGDKRRSPALRRAEADRQLRHRRTSPPPATRPGLVYEPVRRDQLLPVRDHRLAGADALRLHVHQQRARARSTTRDAVGALRATREGRARARQDRRRARRSTAGPTTSPRR